MVDVGTSNAWCVGRSWCARSPPNQPGIYPTYLSVAQIGGLIHPKCGALIVLLAAVAVVISVRDADAALDMILPIVRKEKGADGKW